MLGINSSYLRLLQLGDKSIYRTEVRDKEKIKVQQSTDVQKSHTEMLE